MTLLHPAPGFRTGDKFGARPSFTAGGIKTGAMHGGLDLVPLPGADRTVVAAADGVVVSNRYNAAAGIAVTLWHPALKRWTGYAHLAVRNVTVGQTVTAGQRLGWAGSTGASTGVHLHFDLFTDLDAFNRIDPLPHIGTKAATPPAAATPAIDLTEDLMFLYRITDNDGRIGTKGATYFALTNGLNYFEQLDNAANANAHAKRFGDAVNVSYGEWNRLRDHCWANSPIRRKAAA